MSRIFRWLLLSALLSTPCSFAAAQSWPQALSQTWPERPIKFISSQAAGGGTDIIGRIVADQLAVRVGQPVVYENRPGGGNVIGTQAAARSAPDGYTFFYATAAALVVDPYTFKSLPYDPIKDFTVISRIAEVTFMVLAHPDVPAKNLPELIAYAKANPDKLAVATDGARRFSGMIAAWLNKLAGTTISYVPYTQMTQGVQDVLAGRVQLIIIAVPTAKGHVAAGKLRPLAVTSLRRLPEFPDVQAVAETFPGFDFAGWFALAAPAGVPPAIIERVHKELNAILQDPAVSDKLKTMSFVPYGGGTLRQTQDYVDAQHKAWATLVREIGLQPE
jgi:tripartite-type tricarboxylate transporter receptor subunit TctC